MPSLRLCGLILLSSLLCPLEARLNLPQRADSIELAEPAREKLRAGLAKTPALLPPLSNELETLLVESLPAEWRSACPEIVGRWGDAVASSARWSVRGLFLGRDAAQLTLILAYRCGSSLPNHARVYDERLAAVSLEPKAARLRFLPFADDCDNCSELSHLQFSTVFPVEGGDLLELRLNLSSENPCCDGPSSWREERLLYLTLPKPALALTLVRAEARNFHDDEEGDSVTTCEAAIRYDSNQAGRIEEILSERRCRLDGQPQPVEARRYRWNRASRRLEEVKSAPSK